MENKEITILDLVKIAVRWFWVLVLGALVCGALAFFYASNFVTPMYSSKSEFVIQTKGQGNENDVLESQRTVAYAQLVVGTYIDILDTKNFSEELAYYMNGGTFKETYSADQKEEIVNSAIKHAIVLDGGIIEDGNLRRIIDNLLDSGALDEKFRGVPTSEVVEQLLMNSEFLQTHTEEEIAQEVERSLSDETWLPNYVSVNRDETEHKNKMLEQLGLGGGKSYKNKEYTAQYIKNRISFSTAEESTTFSLTVKSTDYEEAYTIAKLCELVVADYIEEIYPGSGVVTTIDKAVMNNRAINDKTSLTTMAGILLGFIVAYVIVYIIELADNRIKNEEELAEKTGLSVVGIIPDTQVEKHVSRAYSKKTK